MIEFDHRHLPKLPAADSCARGEQPRGYRTTQKREQLTSLSCVPMRAKFGLQLSPSKQESTPSKTGGRCCNVRRTNPDLPLSAWGQSRRSRFGRESASLPISDMSGGRQIRREVPGGDICSAAKLRPIRSPRRRAVEKTKAR